MHYQKTSKAQKGSKKPEQPREPKEPKEAKEEPKKRKGKKEKKDKEEETKKQPETPSDSEDEYAEDATFTVGYDLESGTLFNSTFDPEPEEDSEAPIAPEYSHSTVHNNKGLWLFDTGSTVHICNNKSLFSELSRPKRLGVVRTGGGTVKPEGVGTVKINVLAGFKEGKAFYNTLALTETLYIPGFPLNIVSGHRLYASGGTLIKQKLYSASSKVIALLNFQKSGFFFSTKGSKASGIRPLQQAYGSLWHCYSSLPASLSASEGVEAPKTPAIFPASEGVGAP